MSEYDVEGMHCAHCEMLVRMELEDAGATNVEADAKTGKVRFEGDLDREAVARAIETAGFKLA